MAEALTDMTGAHPPAAGLAAADRRFTRLLDEAFDEALRRAGEYAACRPGCFECCLGPFSITRLDAWRLRRGLEDIRETDPGRAREIVRRARHALAVLRAGFPGDAATGLLDEEQPEDETYYDRHGSLPCPALDPRNGLCDLYAARPATCRVFGPPTRIGANLLPSCRLWLDGASRARIEACRFEPDPGGVEKIILARFSEEIGEDHETFAAITLAEERP